MADTDKEQAPKRSSALRQFGILVIVVALLLFVFRGGKGRSADPGKVVTPGCAKGFNVLFVTLDTTRPEHLGCYGNKLAVTPTIDGLAAHGMRFTDAVTSVPLTLPSHSVMMTGRYPPSIGVRQNGQHLGDQNVTLAEVLSSNGYETAAFVGSFVLDKRFGLSQGFGVYDFELGRDDESGADSLMGERGADEVSSRAIDWLRQRKKRSSKEPFFCWLHYYDPHFPYVSPLANTQPFADRPYGAYDAEIALVDLHLKRVLDTLAQQGLTDRTLVVLATDHGEGFLEKGEAYHGIFLYESTLHAAMIFSNPVLFDKAFVVSDRVAGTVDLFPTILDLLGMPKTPGLEGISLLSPRDPDRAVYIETRFPLANGCHPLYGLRRHTDKYIEAPESEYYDLVRDPHEDNNLIATAPARKAEAQFASMKKRWAGDLDKSGVTSLSAEGARKLEALGYTGGSSLSGDLPDPKEHIEIINKMSEVTRLKALKRYDEAIALAKSVEAESPCWYPPYKNLAELYRDTGQPEKARDVFLRFLCGADLACGDADHGDQDPGCPPESEMLYHFATLLFYQLHDPEAALERLAHAEELDSQLGVIYMLRGQIYESQGKKQDAAQQYELALKRDLRVAEDARRELKRIQTPPK